MAARKTERQLNLLIALMTARRPLSRSEIRAAVSGYGRSDPNLSDDEDAAFLRMFERDKQDLREMGVQLETVQLHLWNEEAYRLPPGGLALQPLDLTPDEAAAVAMAIRAWRRTDLAAQAARAAAKLDLLSVETADALPVTLEPVEAAGAAPRHAWDDLRAAAEHRRVVSFEYRPAGSAGASARTVEPFGLVAWRGHWYLVGHDRDRDAVRSFRLSRIVGSVRLLARAADRPRPDGDLAAYVRGLETAPATVTAQVRVRPGRGLELRRSATGEAGQGLAGWDELTVASSDLERLAGLVAGAGADAVAAAPAPVRQAVVDRLRAAAERHAGAAWGAAAAPAPRGVP